MTGTAMNTSGSSGLTPYSTLEIRGAMIPDKIRPIANPMPARPAPRLTIIFPIVEGMAPSAIRTPISCDR